ncbi:NAD(P)/FAD-dependent oxidoreductase [uncultured Tateyamaria sp.]|uniref:NAD(P)/FAD-dependent oxidoreductase n=2 Tax=uncultured Tateyamaria sp. TaxID=455651 RepID=UPI0026242358|nr:FAD-dependent oxidoreductase [uncultured Tateyamaria sp.]
MQKTDQIAVIGAGLAGLTVARALVDRGHSVVIFDKGRGLGGRMASRRKDGWRFDHGAVALRPTEDAFTAFVNQSEAQGNAAHWKDAGGWTGLPGMSGLVKPVANGLTIHTQAEVTGLDRGPDGWTLRGPAEAAGIYFDHLILAIPQPQAHRLLSPWPYLQTQIEPAEMAPCWTQMVGFETPLPTDVTYASRNEGPISVIARETAKPGRDLPGDGWVIQASADWSHEHLERDRAEVETPLLDAFFTALDCAPVTPEIGMVHRWRYAQTAKPLGQAYLHDASLGLSVCGDWCLGNTAQDAFNSGRLLATALISE